MRREHLLALRENYPDASAQYVVERASKDDIAFLIEHKIDADFCWVSINPFRVRKLLLHKKEINKLLGKIKQDGLTLVPLSLYYKGPRVKMELGLCKGKKLYDKRDDMAKRDAQRNIDRAMKDFNRR